MHFHNTVILTSLAGIASAMVVGRGEAAPANVMPRQATVSSFAVVAPSEYEVMYTSYGMTTVTHDCEPTATSVYALGDCTKTKLYCPEHCTRRGEGVFFAVASYSADLDNACAVETCLQPPASTTAAQVMTTTSTCDASETVTMMTPLFGKPWAKCTAA